MGEITPNIIFYFLSLLMIFIGLPHGAADIIVMHRLLSPKKAILYSLLYLLFFIFGLILWSTNSDVYFFILWTISTIHFLDIEKQFVKKSLPAYEDVMFYTLYTLPIIKMDEFNSYLTLLNGKGFFQEFMSFKIFFIIIQLILTVNVLFRSIKLNHIKRYILIWSLVILTTSFLNLITCFILIFIFVHSLRHMQLSYKKGLINKKNYFFVLLPVSFFSLLLIQFYQQYFSKVSEDYLFFIVGLGSLTIPHLLIEVMLSKKIKKVTEYTIN